MRIQIGGDREEERRAFEGASSILYNFCMTCPLLHLDGGPDHAELAGNFA